MALLPLAATLGYYALPARLQDSTLLQFAPQLLAYAALGLWAARNAEIAARLGLSTRGWQQGVRWGVLTGLSLGCVNSWVILVLTPSLGYDIAFLRTTPHAHIPIFIMVPWFIGGITLFVELNFRGFLLGRLAAIEGDLWRSEFTRRFSPLALLISALAFAFDPFMVNTFQHLHWIALWDGLIWGIIRLRLGNLYATIVAHSVEVMMMYSIIRRVLIS